MPSISAEQIATIREALEITFDFADKLFSAVEHYHAKDGYYFEAVKYLKKIAGKKKDSIAILDSFIAEPSEDDIETVREYIAFSTGPFEEKALAALDRIAKREEK